MSERTRPPRGAQEDQVPSLPAYDEAQVALILQRAAGLEQKRKATRAVLSLDEVAAIAAEAGLDPALVRQAAQELATEREQGLAVRLAGAPLQHVFERVVEGELDTAAHEQLADDIRRAVDGITQVPPHVATLGRSLSFSAFTRGGAVEVQLTPRDGRTHIRVKIDARSQAGGFFGGIIGGVGGGFGSNLAWILPVVAQRAGLPVGAGLALGALGLGGVLLGAYGLARSLFVRSTSATRQRMTELADTLEQHVRAANEAQGGR